MSVVVSVVGTRLEADMVTGLLKTHGIRATVSADDAGGMWQMPLLGHGVRVLVDDEDAAEAFQLLDLTGARRAESVQPNAFQRWVGRVLGGNEPS